MKTAIRSGSALFTIAALLLLGGCNGSSSNYSTTAPPTTTPPPANTVQMVGYSFNPANLTVTANTTVTWTNNSGVTHTSTSDNGVWDTGDIAPGQSKTTTFTTAGTYPFHCRYHSMMVGTITVK